MDARFVRAGSVALAMCGPLVGASRATPVDSRGFFDPYSPTITMWEVDGSGAPVVLAEGESQLLPADEYLSSGFRFNHGIAWVNDASPSFNGAQALVGSPQNAIPSGFFDSFEVIFSSPTDAFGFVVINNVAATVLPSFTAYNALNQVIESVNWGPAFIDGTLGTAQYGFMGIASPDNKIARVAITKQSAIFDDFLFATVPTPSTLAVLGLGALTLSRRRTPLAHKSSGCSRSI